jgi:soluble lytic murein transglycosylase-like protein
MFVPEINIKVGCWYLRHLIGRWKGDITKGLQSYNQGAGRVARSPEAGLWYAAGVLRHKAEFDKIINAAAGNDQAAV